MTNNSNDTTEFFNVVTKTEKPGNSTARPRISYNGEDVDSPVCESDLYADDRGGKASSMWAVYDGTNFVSCDETVKTLPPGMYTTQESRSLGIYLRKETIVLDDLISLPDHTSSQIMSDVDTFWAKEDHFKKLGFVWKRGILLWGPPGSGKTSTLQQLSAKFIEKGGICIFMNHPKILVSAVRMLRIIEPHRPIAVLMEDLDAILYEYGESDLLALMDGELQIDNVLFVATTNYPEKLDRRLVCRPSRFDIIRKVGMPTADAREVYLQTKNKRLCSDSAELADWVKQTEGFSLAHLKELIISVEVFEISVEESIKRLCMMTKHTPSSTDSDGGFGFTS